MPFGSSARLLIASLLLAVVAGCSGRPYVVGPPKALLAERAAAVKAGLPAPRLLSLCYGRPLNTPEELLAEARYQCGGEGEVTYLDSDLFWTPCSLLQPVRASFFCQP